MAVANPHVARTTIKALVGRETALSPEGPRSHGDTRLTWEETLLPKPVMVLDRDMGKALEMAERLEKIAADLPGLDCGACGAPDCRALAEDIVKGRAKTDDCIVRIKEKSVKIAGMSN